MANATAPSTFKRAINGLLAAALAAFLLMAYWPVTRVLDLSRGDLMIEGVWIGGHAKRIRAVTPGGPADRAGLRVGDVLEFDPDRAADWVLAGYREMPEGFSASLSVRHADGSPAVVTLAPERVAYLPTLNDRLAVLAHLLGVGIAILVGVLMVWARPSLLTWSLLLTFVSGLPARPWRAYFLAFEAAGPTLGPAPLLVGSTPAFGIMLLPFVLCFPRDGLDHWSPWKRAVFLTVLLAWGAFAGANSYTIPFERDTLQPFLVGASIAWSILVFPLAIAALARTYRKSGESERARLRWTLLGISAALVGALFSLLFIAVRSIIPHALSESPATPGHWMAAIGLGVLFPLSISYAVLRQRVIDVQFAISRTLVFGVVSTLALVFIAAVHWLLGRMLEQSRLAIGLEGIAAIGLGLVLHRAARSINLLVDRVLFRKHHQAEERLRLVTAALPYATNERSITEAVVTEPVRNLDLASAALFYRDSADGPLRRVLSHGWGESHAASLDADSLLVRYLQAEHAPLKLDDPHLLPASIPDGAARPMLAIPVVTQHDVTAIVLYGSHANHTLLDPDEVDLLQALAKAAATSHQRVRISTLMRENAALTVANSVEKVRNDQLEASAAELRALVQARMLNQGGAGTSGDPA